MSGQDLTLAMRLYADTTRWVSGLANGSRGVDSFVDHSKRKLAELRQVFGSVEGRLAGLGVSIGGVAAAVQSAHLDKDLMRISQTAAMSREETVRLRGDLFRMAKDTGASVDELKGSFDNAVQAGLSFKEALPVTDAVNTALAVTGASADKLTSALTVASTAFEFDLTKPGMALDLLDKMTVSGRAGNAELQNLSDIFARVAVNSRGAGFGFDQTLAFIEGLSKMEKQPERLATLADSTLRLFTNANYMKDAAAATGIRFFNKSDGNRRDPMAVLADLRSQYTKLSDDKEKAKFLDKAFGRADQDTQRGLKILFTGQVLEDIKRFSKESKSATGTLNRDLHDAISNSIDQTGRLKSALREAADGFIQPINEAISNAAGFIMADKKDLGYGVSGKDMAIGGLEVAGGAFALSKLFGMIFGKGKNVTAAGNLLQTGTSLAGNIAIGKGLSQVGVQSVFVVNMPFGGIGGGATSVAGTATGVATATATATTAAGTAARVAKDLRLLSGLAMTDIAGLGAGAMATAGLGVTVAGLGGAAIGTGIYKLIENSQFADKLGEGIARAMAGIGNDQAREAINQRVTGKVDLNIKVDSDGRASVQQPGPVLLEPPARNRGYGGPLMWGN